MGVVRGCMAIAVVLLLQLVALAQLKLSDFNPPADDTTDAGPAIQRMIDFGYANGISSFEFQPRVYLVDTTVNLPQPVNATQANEIRTAIYEGNGCTFKVGSGDTVFKRTYANVTDQVDTGVTGTTWWNPRFQNMTFINGGDGSGRAIQMWGAGSVVCSRLHASGLGTPGSGAATTVFEILFCLYAKFENCTTTGCGIAFAAYGGQGVNGPWLTGGTSSNHNCNLVRYESCRTQLTDANAVGFYIELATNYTLQSCTTEGTTGSKCVVINAETEDVSMVTAFKDDVSGRIIDHWVEMTSSIGTVFEINVQKANTVIDNVRWGGDVGTAATGRLIDGANSERSVFVIQNTAWQEIQADSMTQWFDQGQTAASVDSQWHFQDNILQTGNTLSDSGKWETTSGVPTNLTEVRTFAYDAP